MELKTTGKGLPVLVLGEDSRSFLSVIRSLGRAGYAVYVVCYDQTSPALKSKYIKSAWYYNYQALTAEAWLEKVMALIERYQFKLVVPCDERAIYPLWSARERLPELTRLAIANPAGLDILFDKWKTKQAALACGVPVASGCTVPLANTRYETLLHQFGPSFVIKPLQSFAQTKLSERQKVAIIDSEQDFIDYQQTCDVEQDYLIEAFFAGKGEGVSVLAIDGDVEAAFAHVRVAEPKRGGGSSYRKSIPLATPLLDATRALCRYTRLTGVAMFEFRRRQTGSDGGVTPSAGHESAPDSDWILVEVNARFWGSLPLAIYAGVDFPRLYADYLALGDKPSQPILQYRYQVSARALSADIYEMKREFELSRAEHHGIRAGGHLMLRLMQISRLFTPWETVDSFQWRDAGPFMAELRSLAQSLLWSRIQRNPVSLSLRRHRVHRTLLQLFRLNPQRRVLFVCYGNIMRSPFAEVCCQQSLQQEPFAIELDSFGFHLTEQRRCPQVALAAAQQLGEDLTHHSSKWLTQTDIRPSDILIYFDHANQYRLAAYYHVNHTFCAADLFNHQIPVQDEIADPYGQSSEIVGACYRQIQQAVTGLIDIYKGAVQ